MFYIRKKKKHYEINRGKKAKRESYEILKYSSVSFLKTIYHLQ